ncbi:hypothetical protein ACNPQM_08455 [Streptomyces sp. NPDC056231]|uniref:hypothetical protein n=1 Tax=Streptomyces sp. NPDC056231 TaxID=3345755 RepID=UPI003AB03D77
MNHGPENSSNAQPNGPRDPLSDGDATTEAAASVTGAAGVQEEQGETSDPAGTARIGGLPELFDMDPGDGSGAAGGSGPDLDELALRRMFHGAVQDLAPTDGALDHLRRAVPARRARRRQAIVGMAAAALLIGTAVPAFVHVAGSTGSDTANPAIAGHSEQAQGGNSADSGSAADEKSQGGSTDGHSNGSNGHPNSTSSPSGSGGTSSDGSASGGGAGPADTKAVTTPVCDPGQLGVASAQAGAAGADGTVYGTFRISNISGTDCTVTSSGTVGFETTGAADPARIDVVQHTAGDPAAGLPDPSQEAGTVLLKPSMTYEVQFAWVPKDTCPTAGSSPTPTPTDGTVGTSGGTTEGASQTEPQLAGGDGGGTLDGSVAVTHTPEPGSQVAEARIPNACAGTIYRTGVIVPSA